MIISRSAWWRWRGATAPWPCTTWQPPRREPSEEPRESRQQQQAGGSPQAHRARASMWNVRTMRRAWREVGEAGEAEGRAPAADCASSPRSSMGTRRLPRMCTRPTWQRLVHVDSGARCVGRKKSQRAFWRQHRGRISQPHAPGPTLEGALKERCGVGGGVQRVRAVQRRQARGFRRQRRACAAVGLGDGGGAGVSPTVSPSPSLPLHTHSPTVSPSPSLPLCLTRRGRRRGRRRETGRTQSVRPAPLACIRWRMVRR
jgi:hypothetical protein